MKNILIKTLFHLALIVITILVMWEFMDYSFGFMNKPDSALVIIGFAFLSATFIGGVYVIKNVADSLINLFKTNKKEDEQSN